LFFCDGVRRTSLGRPRGLSSETCGKDRWARGSAGKARSTG
jgi:hypothetical protein